MELRVCFQQSLCSGLLKHTTYQFVHRVFVLGRGYDSLCSNGPCDISLWILELLLDLLLFLQF